MISYFAIVWLLARKDLVLESRNRDIFIAIVMFAALVLSIFAIAVEPATQRSIEAAPGILWTAIAFAGVVGLARSISHETDGDAIAMLMLAPVSRDLIFLGKSLATFIFLVIAQAVIFVLFALLFNISTFKPEIIAAGLLVGLGFSGVGTMFTSLTLRVRAREIMLPMLFLPTVSPLLFAAIRITSETLAGGSWGTSSVWLQLGIVYDIVFLAAAALLYGYILED